MCVGQMRRCWGWINAGGMRVCVKGVMVMGMCKRSDQDMGKESSLRGMECFHS